MKKDLGLLILRLGIGLSFVLIHGYPKLMGGPERWTSLGSTLSVLGISFAPVFWGFMASFAEFFGALGIMLGVYFRASLVLLFSTMVIATLYHIFGGDSLGKTSHALELAIVFAGMFFLGAGKYSLNKGW